MDLAEQARRTEANILAADCGTTFVIVQDLDVYVRE